MQGGRGRVGTVLGSFGEGCGLGGVYALVVIQTRMTGHAVSAPCASHIGVDVGINVDVVVVLMDIGNTKDVPADGIAFLEAQPCNLVLRGKNRS